MRVELRDEARNDLVNGAFFYGRQSPGLGEYFIECIRQDLQNLDTTFGVHEQYRGFYRKLSKQFPFVIYYQLHEDIVDVVAVLDGRTDPDGVNFRLGQTAR